jgi:hypothetical protein
LRYDQGGDQINNVGMVRSKRGDGSNSILVWKVEIVSSRRENCVVSKQSNGKRDSSGCYSIIQLEKA